MSLIGDEEEKEKEKDFNNLNSKQNINKISSIFTINETYK